MAQTTGAADVRNSGDKINVLLMGSGGREHSLAWRLRQSPRLGELYTDSPSNPGLAALAKPAGVVFDHKNSFAFEHFCETHKIGLLVVGPEEPLANGVVDVALGRRTRLPAGVLMSGGPKQARAGGGPVVRAFGPTKAAAALEADKAFAKELMRSVDIPTAEARAFSDAEAAKNYLRSRTDAQVIKATGLCKGKGVFLPTSTVEGEEIIDRLMTAREFGDAGRTVLIEERLKGREVSVFAVTDSSTLVVLDTCQDHKRLGDGATGPNTGGMGAICPATAAIDGRMAARILSDIMIPTIDALRREDIEYHGVLYAGLMLTPGGPKVLEFNCRFGDPECQCLMMRLESDVLELLLAASDGEEKIGAPTPLDQVELRFTQGCSVCVVIAAPGYPDAPKAGVVIEGVERAAAVEGVQVFHAGTKLDERGRLVTAGGRVLNVCAAGKTAEEARERAYAAAKEITFPGKLMRSDIGSAVVG